MLLTLLRLVAQGGTRTGADLARELEVSEGLVEQMLEDLARMGYLTPVEGSCISQCAACPLAKFCTVGTPTRLWSLTEKGQRAVEKEQRQ